MSNTKKQWDQLSGTEKIALFNPIINEAATDVEIRDKLLVSQESATRYVVSKLGDQVNFPDDFRVRFILDEEGEKNTHFVVFKIPKYEKPQPATKADAGDQVRCTYIWWAQEKPT